MKLKTFIETEYMHQHVAVRIRKGSEGPTLGSLKNYIIPLLGDLETESVKAYDLTKFRNELHRRGLSPKTIRNHQSVLRTVLKLAVEAELIPSLPTMKSEKFRYKDMYWLKPSEEAALKQYAALERDLRWQAMVTLGLHSGMRVGEMRGLEWKHFSCESGEWQLNIVQSVPMQGNEVGPTKTWACRVISANATTVAIIQQLRQFTGHCKFIFGNLENPTHPITNKACRVAMERMRDRARLPKCTWHTLRHTVATKLVNNPGVSIMQVSKLLGHVDIKMTMRYSHEDTSLARLTTAALE